MTITREPFGRTTYGEAVSRYTLRNAAGMSVSILDYGCTIQSVCVRGVDVALGYDTVAEYEKNDGYLGAVVGRHANRIGGGAFELNGRIYTLAKNDGSNHLHGGKRGFDRYVWAAGTVDNRLRLSRISPDGEEGYPGALKVDVEYFLSEDNAISIAYRAECGVDTVLNLTNHCYFNLNGQGSGSILGHILRLDAEAITENDDGCLPTGVICPVEGTPFDFRLGKTIGADIDCGHVQLNSCGGYDHNFVLSGSSLRSIGTLTGDVSGISMEVSTDQPGVQFYTGNFLTPRKGKGGAVYNKRDGLCLETQHFPNAMAQPHFPSVVLKKGEVFTSTTVYRFV